MSERRRVATQGKQAALRVSRFLSGLPIQQECRRGHREAPEFGCSLTKLSGCPGNRRSSLVPGSIEGFESANGRTGDNDGSAVSIWTLTLALFVCFLVSSFAAALLAAHFGWLAPPTTPI
jgi:hypothetical protein